MAVAGTLAEFPLHIARKVASPITGVPARQKFLRRIADAYDMAQEAGEVQTAGGDRTSIVPDKNNAPATVEDIGLTRKFIHEARQVRDALNAEPDIIKTTVEAALDLLAR